MDALTAAASSYVAFELGTRFLEPPPFDLAQCYKDSTSQTPLIFILSQGSDPVSELLSFAKEMKMSRRFESISLGTFNRTGAPFTVRPSFHYSTYKYPAFFLLFHEHFPI